MSEDGFERAMVSYLGPEKLARIRSTKIGIAGNHDWAFVEAPEEARHTLGDEIIYLQDSGVVAAGLGQI